MFSNEELLKNINLLEDKYNETYKDLLTKQDMVNKRDQRLYDIYHSRGYKVFSKFNHLDN